MRGAAATQSTKPTKAYNPRHPERTPLYGTIAEHFETWLELASAGQFDGQGDHHTPLPAPKGSQPCLGRPGAAASRLLLQRPWRLRYYLQRDKAPVRAGLERLLRYCARPPFAMDWLKQRGANLVYRCGKGHTEPLQSDKYSGELVLAPLELIDRIAQLVSVAC